MQEPLKGESWIYNQSMRPYIVLKTTINDVHYTAATITLASGKLFIRSRADFLANFTRPEDITDEKVKEAIKNTLIRYRLIE